ncbi:MAG: class I SAM-dependent methyltransferase, partial [Pseudomonadota bacterium]
LLFPAILRRNVMRTGQFRQRSEVQISPMTNAQLFGTYAAAYKEGRPGYPAALFDWIASEAPGRAAVWDAGTGSGQAARALAERFDHVHATDVDADQIAAAEAHERITFTVAPAEASGLPDASADAVTVATALHWFDFHRFWPEVRRVCRPGGIFCGFTYGLTVSDKEVHKHLLDPVLERIDRFWSDGNRLSLRCYPRKEIGFPFEELTPPPLKYDLSWTPTRLLGFMRTWSAHAKARAEGLADDLLRIEEAALRTLGEGERTVTLPMTIIAGRVA